MSDVKWSQLRALIERRLAEAGVEDAVIDFIDVSSAHAYGKEPINAGIDEHGELWAN